MILAVTTAPKVPEWPSYGNFRKVTQNPHFLKKCKRGTKGNFSIIAQKVALLSKAQKLSGGNGIILQLVCAKSTKTGQDFGAKSGSKNARFAKLWQFSQSHPKPAFSEKVQRGDQGKFFKNRPKRCPRLKGPKALWRKWPYPLISMHWKCKDWKRFWRKKRFPKGPNGKRPHMAIYSTSPKTSIFWKSAKGGQREIFQKSLRK